MTMRHHRAVITQSSASAAATEEGAESDSELADTSRGRRRGVPMGTKSLLTSKSVHSLRLAQVARRDVLVTSQRKTEKASDNTFGNLSSNIQTSPSSQ